MMDDGWIMDTVMDNGEIFSSAMTKKTAQNRQNNVWSVCPFVLAPKEHT